VLLCADVQWTAAVRIAYDGGRFMGSQRQPGERTVEGEVLRCLRKIHAIESAQGARFRVASRTDRGVSALCNVICFDTSFREGELLRALNGVAEDVFFLAYAPVPPEFSPRRANGRWYRYLAPAGKVDMEQCLACAQLFVGRHDFKRFCKPEGRSALKFITSIDMMPLGDIMVIDLRAREFLRNMVRRMVAAMLAVGRGEATLDEVAAALQGDDISFGLAPPEGLLLMEVDHGLAWRMAGEQLAAALRLQRWAAMRALLLQEMLVDAAERP
jgi:tRNA pseudouridine38-40 synthase